MDYTRSGKCLHKNRMFQLLDCCSRASQRRVLLTQANWIVLACQFKSNALLLRSYMFLKTLMMILLSDTKPFLRLEHEKVVFWCTFGYVLLIKLVVFRGTETKALFTMQQFCSNESCHF